MAAAYLLGAGLYALAERFSCDPSAIKTQLRRAGVSMRPAHRPRRKWSVEQTAKMVQRWNAGESQTSIARAMSTTPLLVSRQLTQAGIEVVRRAANPRGSRHGMWRGGHIRLHGYVAVHVPRDHRFAAMAMKGGYVLEHRLVMAESLGRPLRANESVHHINGKRDDNRIENLQLRNGKHGKGVVLACLDCGSHNVGEVPISD